MILVAVRFGSYVVWAKAASATTRALVRGSGNGFQTAGYDAEQVEGFFGHVSGEMS